MKCLGKGGSSTVYLVRHKQNCKMYALKQVEKTYITDFKKMEFLLREKKILTEIAKKSYFSSKIYATFESKDHINFLLEYCPGG
jgi:serum/glucocorticoid-regulated kinase 2